MACCAWYEDEPGASSAGVGAVPLDPFFRRWGAYPVIWRVLRGSYDKAQRGRPMRALRPSLSVCEEAPVQPTPDLLTREVAAPLRLGPVSREEQPPTRAASGWGEAPIPAEYSTAPVQSYSRPVQEPSPLDGVLPKTSGFGKEASRGEGNSTSKVNELPINELQHAPFAPASQRPSSPRHQTSILSPQQELLHFSPFTYSPTPGVLSIITRFAALAGAAQHAALNEDFHRKRHLSEVVGAELDPLGLSHTALPPQQKRAHYSSGPSPSPPLPHPQPPLQPETAGSTPHEPLFPLPTGRLADRYELLQDRCLGSGQFGTVWVCRDRLTGQELACKTMLLNGSPSQRREILNEVTAMLLLAGHEGLVQLRGIFEEPGVQVHLVMDLCEGGELFDEVVRRQRFSEPDAAHLFLELAQTLSFMHSRLVVHLDIKPENVLLARPLDGSAPLSSGGRRLLKLADFGLAVPLAPGQTLSGTCGSPFYMAPEVLQGQNISNKADVWSLGVILYIILCGSPPFWGETDQEVFQAIQVARPDTSSPPWQSVSAEAKGLLLSLLDKDPEQRPSAQKVLSHPWLLRHTARHGPRAAAATRPMVHPGLTPVSVL